MLLILESSIVMTSALQLVLCIEQHKGQGCIARSRCVGDRKLTLCLSQQLYIPPAKDSTNSNRNLFYDS